MKVTLRQPTRSVEVVAPIKVGDLLKTLSFEREAVLVMCNGELVTAEVRLEEDDEVEIRNVISGGAL